MSAEQVLLAVIGVLWLVAQGATCWILGDIRDRVVRLENHIFREVA